MALTDVQGAPGTGPAVAPEPAAPPASTTAMKLRTAAPVAAGVVAVVVAVVAGTMATTNGAAPSAPADIPAAATVPAPADPAAPAIPADPAVHPPAQTAPAPRPGSSIPGVQFDQAPPAGVTQSMEIVVKFKDDAKVKDIVDAFWKDQASARAKFDALKKSRAEFANLKLDRVTYSNELVLVHDGSAPAAQRLAAMRDIAAKLGKAADISYAEPNLTAHPGGQ